MRRYLLAVLVLLGLGLGSLPTTLAADAAGLPARSTWKRLSYGVVTFEVPAAWPVHDLASEPARCARLDVHAVYLGNQGEHAACPARAVGRTEALQIQPLAGRRAAAAMATRATTVGGQLAHADPSAEVQRAIVVALDRTGLLLTASYGADPDLAKRILASVRLPGPGAAAPGRSRPAEPGPRAGAAPRAVVPTVFTGKGFDTCAAPSSRSMRAWRASSPYRAAGIYIGGAMRACGDGNLSASWISTVAAMGWHLIPIYVGLQAPCVFQGNLAHIDPARATAQGVQAAADAVARASRVFALGAGTPVYFDMEAYDNRQSGCVRAVLSFLSAWTGELHRRGYRSGVYSSSASGVTDLVRNYNNASLRRPDFIWFAHWTGVASTQDRYLPAWAWPPHRRIGQYRGGHNERWGNVTINIDNDQVDSVVVGTRPLLGGTPPA